MADLSRHPGRLPLRIGDAERDVALQELGDHFAAGRIDGMEFDERASAALAARTQPELDVLFAELPLIWLWLVTRWWRWAPRRVAADKARYSRC